jgi:hypothetical protein
MRRHILFAAILVLASAAFSTAGAGVVRYDRSVDYGAYLKFDRYLNVEIWTDHNEYYEGDKIEFSFKANEDCFVVVYNIDSRGDVHLLYPAGRYDDYRIQGGRIYRVPSKQDDYELTVRGPEGVEYLQIIASREPFPLDDWSDDLYCDTDPYDFMDYINASFFGCNSNCHRAYDMTSFLVREWDDYYFRPVYIYERPHWSYAGSVYIDYPFGASVYINGVYWGVAPLFIPRIYYGWHWITIYDRYGYCWEDRIQVVRRKSVVLNETVVRTKADVVSRYKDVRTTAYRDPVKSGYKDYDTQVVKKREIYETRRNSPQGAGTRMQSDGQPGSRYGERTTSSTRAGSSNQSGRSTESGGTYDRRTRSTRSGSDANTGQGESGSSSRRSASELKSDRRGSNSRTTEPSTDRRTTTTSRTPRSTQEDKSGSTKRSEPAKDQPSSSPSVKGSGQQERQPSSGSGGSAPSRSGGNQSESRRSR